MCWLKSIPETALFHVAQGVRHPESTYRLSLAKIREKFVEVAETYLELTVAMSPANIEDVKWRSLLDAQDFLLRALQDHLDDCYLVVKALIDPDTAKTGSSSAFNQEYVLKNLPGAKSFKDAVVGYKTSLRIANKLKHQQGRLRGISVLMPGSIHHGYYLKRPDTNGALGPSIDVHPNCGCFSFAGDLRSRIFQIYDCSRHLTRAVQRAFTTTYQSSLRPSEPIHECRMEQADRTRMATPDGIFPEGDRHKTVARTWSEDDGINPFCVEYLYHMRIVLPRPVSVTVSAEVDGNSPTISVPFP